MLRGRRRARSLLFPGLCTSDVNAFILLTQKKGTCISDIGSTLEQLEQEQERLFVLISRSQPCGAAAQDAGVFESLRDAAAGAVPGTGCLRALPRGLCLYTTAMPWCCHWICLSEGQRPPSSCHWSCVAFLGMVCSAILSSFETCLCKTNLALL